MSKASEKFFQLVNNSHRALTPDAIDDVSIEYRGKFQHMWVAISTYHVSEESMRQYRNPDAKLTLDNENLMAINFGCFNCEEPFAPGLLGTQCGGTPMTTPPVRPKRG